MGLGLERALAAYVASVRGYGLWDDLDLANRVLFLGPPPVPGTLPIPDDGSVETLSPLAVSITLDGGRIPRLNLLEPHRVTVSCRHPQYEVAMEEQRSLHVLLHENGGTGRNAMARGVFPGNVRISKITAESPPLRLGRDPSNRDGRAITSQVFIVSALTPIPFV